VQAPVGIRAGTALTAGACLKQAERIATGKLTHRYSRIYLDALFVGSSTTFRLAIGPHMVSLPARVLAH